MIALVEPLTPAASWLLLVATAVVLSAVMYGGLIVIDRLASRFIAWKVGGSLSWNDEGPAQVDARRTSSATRSRKG